MYCKVTPELKAALRDDYDTGMFSHADLAEKYELARNTVARYLPSGYRLGIRVRPSGPVRRMPVLRAKTPRERIVMRYQGVTITSTKNPTPEELETIRGEVMRAAARFESTFGVDERGRLVVNPGHRHLLSVGENHQAG